MSAFAGGLGERPSLFRQEEIMDKKIPSRHGGGKGGRKKGLIDQSWGHSEIPDDRLAVILLGFRFSIFGVSDAAGGRTDAFGNILGIIQDNEGIQIAGCFPVIGRPVKAYLFRRVGSWFVVDDMKGCR